MSGARASRAGGADRWWLWLLAFALLACSLTMAGTLGKSLRSGQDLPSGGRTPSLAADERDLMRVRDIRLTMAEGDWNFFFTRPPLSLTAFQEARLVLPDRPRPLKVDVRVRGGHAWHWQPEKPSLRVRLPNGRLFDGRQILDLINPEDPAMLANLLADFLAAEAGVAASVTRWARVWLNDRFLGLYHLTDRLDGALLARLGLAEWPVAEGNRRVTDLWSDPDLWEIHGGAMTARDVCRPILTRLLNLARPPVTLDRVANLEKFIDLERMASWSALMTAIGSLQADDVHNQHWAYATPTARFWPVVSDSTGFGVLTRIGLTVRREDVEMWPYEFLFPFLNAALRNPYFVARRNLALWRLLQGTLRPDRVASLARRLHDVVAEDISRDRLRGGLINVPELGIPLRIPVSTGTVDSEASGLGRWMARRGTYLEGVLASLTVTLYPPVLAASSSGWVPVPVAVWGHAPAEWDLGEFASSMRRDGNRDGLISGDDAPCSPTLRLHPAVEEQPAAGHEWLRGDRRLHPYLLAPATQTFLLGMPSDLCPVILERMQGSARNAVTGRPVVVSIDRTASPTLYTHSQSLHPWTLPPGNLDW